ncbi:MAG: chloride channel protein [Flavobacteriales bacterium]|nr:chloride channel protein [Flavobacteriales bacterium]
MNRKILQSLKSFLSTHQMALTALVIGIISGVVAFVLKSGVKLFQSLFDFGAESGGIQWWLVILPSAGLIVVYVVLNILLKYHPGAGIPAVLQAIGKGKGKISRKQILSASLGSLFTVGTGGSAGLEGPTVQVSAALGSLFSSNWKPDFKTRRLYLACACAGSMAAIFKAPVAAIVFAIEVIMIDLTAMSLVPLLLASIGSFIVSILLMGDHQLFSISLRSGFEMKHIHHYILLGLLCGFGSVYFSRIYLFIIRQAKSIRSSRKRLLICCCLISIIFLLIPSLYGEGYALVGSFLNNSTLDLTANSIMDSFNQGANSIILILLAALLLKVVVTGLTVSGGGVGGIFAPSLFMGATLGMIYSKSWSTWSNQEVPTTNLVLVAMGGLLAGVLHAPLTGMFLIAELSGGYSLLVPLMLTTALAFYISKGINNLNIYTEELAQKGELLTHNKDQAVLTLMSLKDEIETNFSTISPFDTLGEMIPVIANSQRNLFPVLSPDGMLIGIIELNEIRKDMFDSNKYDELQAKDLMYSPPETVQMRDTMEQVMNKFDQSGAWNLPVVEDGKYIGFVSKSKLFTAYRHFLKETNLA